MRLRIAGAVYSPCFADNHEDARFFSASVKAVGGEFDVRVRCPYKEIKKWEDRTYVGLLLHNPEQRESDIFPVRLSHPDLDGIVGWLIPLQSLSSTEHQRADDESHFVPIVTKAYDFLLNKIDVAVDASNELLSRPFVDLVDLFPSELAVLIIDQAESAKYDLESFESILAGLFAYGYWVYNGIDKHDKRGAAVQRRMGELRTGNSIKINRPSNSSISPLTIEELLRLVIANRSSSLATFLIFYQVFEILTDVVLYDKAREIVAKLTKETDNLAIRDLLNAYSEISKEKSLIGALFSNRIGAKPNRQELELKCAVLLKNAGTQLEEGIKFPATFYIVRNHLVHNTKKFSGPLLGCLEEINQELEVFAPEMFIHFSQTGEAPSP